MIIWIHAIKTVHYKISIKAKGNATRNGGFFFAYKNNLQHTVQYDVDSPVLMTIKAEYEGPHTLTCERRQSKMRKLALNLQFFASMDDVITAHADAFGDGDTTKDSFTSVSDKLKELGYDVLINQRDKAEFVPASRLSEVVAQRETFKTQAEQAIVELNKLKQEKGISEEAQTQINTLIGQNEALLNQLQEANVQLEIMSTAADAINPKDVLPFVDMTKIKKDKDGNVIGGVKEEVDRIRTEKPYLFNKKQQEGSRGGFDGSGSNGGNTGGQKTDMNAAIRRAAFGGSRSF